MGLGGFKNDVEYVHDLQLFRSGVQGETLRHSLARFTWFEDFMSASLTGSALVARDTSAAGTPTMAQVTDEPFGVWQIALDTGSSEAETATYDFNDVLKFNPYAGKCVFEARLKLKVLTGANVDFICGLCSAYSTTLDNITSNIWFRLVASSANLYVEADDGTSANDKDDQDTGLDLVADDRYRVYRIEFDPDTEVATFYVDGKQVLASTTFSLSNWTSAIRLQPIVGFQRASGTGAGTVEVDYMSFYCTGR